MVDTTWIVVADSTRARVFVRHPPNRLEPVTELSHEASRLHGGDLKTGGRGTTTDRAGSGQRQSDPHITPSEQETLAFAREVGGELDKARHANRFDQLVLAAEPAFLGAVRQHLGSATRQCVVRTIDKNWTHQSDDELARLLERHL